MKHPTPFYMRLLAALCSTFIFTAPVLGATDAAPASTAAPAIAAAAGTAAPAAKNTAIIPVPQKADATSNYQKVHQQFVAQAKKGDIDVMFLGDSITDFWTGASSGGKRATGKAVWDKYFVPLKAANFGYTADRTQHVLWRLQNGEGQGFKPKVIVLMIGTNNTGVESRTAANSPQRNTTAEAVEGVTAVVQELRKDFPDSKILLLAIFPRDDDQLAKKQGPEINKEIAKLDDQKHVFFLDINKNFLDANGNLIAEDFGLDKLHPSAEGYQVWADAIKDPLAKLLK